jgi:hypothetical protein
VMEKQIVAQRNLLFLKSLTHYLSQILKRMPYIISTDGLQRLLMRHRGISHKAIRGGLDKPPLYVTIYLN